MSNYGAQDMVSQLGRVLVCAPSATMGEADPAVWHYGRELGQSDLDAQHREFVEVLSRSGAEVLHMPDAPAHLYDSIFTHDPSLVTRAGAILLRMGKPLRREEVAAHRHSYAQFDIPVLGSIEAPGTVEAGDCLWVKPDLLVVGQGFRTNAAGIEQLRALLEPVGVEVVSVDLPVYTGADACLHLMSIVSLLDHDLALVYLPLLPVAFYQLLQAHGVEMVAAPEDEFVASNGLNLNVLATQPRHGIMVEGMAKTQAALEASGCHIDTFNGDTLCIQCEGGPTCLTRPLLRSA